MWNSRSTKTVFLYPCTCGKSLELTRGQAGSAISYPMCDRSYHIVSLGSLQHLESIEKAMPPNPAFQFRVQQLLLAFVPFAMLSWLTTFVGVPPVLIFVGGLVGYCLAAFLLALFIHKAGWMAGEIWDRFEGKQVCDSQRRRDSEALDRRGTV